MEGENLAEIEGLYYKLGYRSQSQGDADIGTNRETGYVATLGHSFPVSDFVQMDALAEYVDIHHFDGGASDNRYLTASLITHFDHHWNLTTAYTKRDIDTPSVPDTNDYMLQISAGYDFDQGTTIELGWRRAEESNSKSTILGALVRHSFEF